MSKEEQIKEEIANLRLPVNNQPNHKYNQPSGGTQISAGYTQAQQDMLTPKDGEAWVKCKVRGEYINCPICQGIGGIPLVGEGVHLNPCPRCGGTGKVKCKEEQNANRQQNR